MAENGAQNGHEPSLKAASMDRCRSSPDLLEKAHEALTLDPSRTASLLIDMHRGHLDPEVATRPVPAEWARRVVGQARQLLGTLRQMQIPVIHIVTVYRFIPGFGSESNHKAYARARRELERQLRGPDEGRLHNLEGSVQTQVMPELGPEKGDYLIDTKKTYNAFYGTDLEILLRVLNADTLIIMGVNTNTCILCTTFEAANRGYRPIVVADCVVTTAGEALHRFALENIRRSLGWVLTAKEVEGKLLQTMPEENRRAFTALPR